MPSHRPLPRIFLVTAPSSRIAGEASFPNRPGRYRARGLCSQGYAMIGGAWVLNAAISIYFADATLAGAFVARWCVGSKPDTAGGIFHVREDEPAPRGGSGTPSDTVTEGDHGASLPEHERQVPTSVGRNHLPTVVALLYVGVISWRVLAIPVLCVRSVAVVAFVRIRVIRPAQPRAQPQPTEDRGQDDAAVEAMVVEPLALKSVSVKPTAVKPAMGKSSKSPVKSAWPAVKPTAVEPTTAIVRAGGTGLEERSSQEQCS